MTLTPNSGLTMQTGRSIFKKNPENNQTDKKLKRNHSSAPFHCKVCNSEPNQSSGQAIYFSVKIPMHSSMGSYKKKKKIKSWQ